MRGSEEHHDRASASGSSGGLRPDGGQSTAEHTLRRLRRHAWLIATCALTVPAVALVLSLASAKEYTATAALLFQSSNVDQRVFGTPTVDDTRDPLRVATTNLKLVSLRVVAARTAQSLRNEGLTGDAVAGKVDVAPEGESNIAAIKARDRDPTLAARIANQYGVSFISLRRAAQRATIDRAQVVLEHRFASLAPAAQRGAEGRRLRARASDLAVLAGLQSGDAALVQPAEIPTSPSSPKTARNVALGVLLGLALGVGLAMLLAQFDRRLRDADDVADVLDLPVLAEVPLSSSLQSAVGEDRAWAGSGIDAFTMLRANLKYFNVDRPITTILVTSPQQADGSTTVACGLAMAEARAGVRVLCIEADLRAPTLWRTAHGERNSRPVEASGRHKDRGPGLTAVLSGSTDPAAAVRTVAGVDIITAGRLPPNPAELLESQRMADLLVWARERYERVIIDTPPTPSAPDAIPLIGQVDGVLVVVRLDHTRSDHARRLADHLLHGRAPVLGLVLNGSSSPGAYQPRREDEPAHGFGDMPGPLFRGRTNGAAAGARDSGDREAG